MHSSEIEDRWWTIPATRSKNKKEHRVYLSDMALELIGPIKNKGFIFPSPRSKVNGTSINRHALSSAIIGNCPSKCAYDCRACTIEECLAIQLSLEEKNRLGIPHFTPHDLRRTGATGLAKLKYSDEVIDAVLNHAKQGVVKIYNRYRYDKEKQQALEKWARQLKKLSGYKARFLR
jgi:integrase